LIILILLFSFKGEVILANPLIILWIAVPLFIQTVFIFSLEYIAAKCLKLKYEDAAPAAMIGRPIILKWPFLWIVLGCSLSYGGGCPH
jgi:arsenite transporter